MSKNTNKDQNQQKVVETTMETVETKTTETVNTEATTVPENPPVANPETTVEPQISETTTESTDAAEPKPAASVNVEVNVTNTNAADQAAKGGNGSMNYKEQRAAKFYKMLEDHGMTVDDFIDLFQEGTASQAITPETIKKAAKRSAELEAEDRRNQAAADKANKPELSKKKKILITAGAVAGAAVVGFGVYSTVKYLKNKHEFENDLGCESGEDLGLAGYIPEIPDDPFA